MDQEKRLKLVKNVAAILLIVAFLCYASPPEKPECPTKVVMDNDGGMVVLNHQQHFDSSGYGLDCFDCHHHFVEDEADITKCKTCHLKEIPETPPEACLDCHDADEIEDAAYPKSKDAFHKQCGDCHKEYGLGPWDVKSDDKCTKCHFKANI